MIAQFPELTPKHYPALLLNMFYQNYQILNQKQKRQLAARCTQLSFLIDPKEMILVVSQVAIITKDEFHRIQIRAKKIY